MESLLDRIADTYQLPSLQISGRIEDGFLSENYALISGDKKYFLKKYRFDNPDKVKQVHRIKRYFFDNSIPVILPIEQKTVRHLLNMKASTMPFFPLSKMARLSMHMIANRVEGSSMTEP